MRASVCMYRSANINNKKTLVRVSSSGSLLLQLLAEHVVQNAAVLEELHLDERVDAQDARDLLAAADVHRHLLARLQLPGEVEVERLLAGEAKGMDILAGLELQRDNAHANKVAAVNALEALGNHNLDALQVRPLGRPVARGPAAVLLASQDHQRRARLLVLHRGVEDRQLLAGGEVDRVRARLALANDLVAQARVREGAAHHDQVVSTARTVRVEVLALDARLLQEARSRGVLRDVAGGGDVVRGDGVAKHAQHRGVLDHRLRLRLALHASEVRGVVDVRRLLVPRVQLALRGLQRIPLLVVRQDALVHVREQRGGHAAVDDVSDLLRRWPDVAQVHTVRDRLRVEVDVDAASEGVRDDQGRRCEVVRGGLRVDAGLEVAVAREHGGGDDVVVRDRLGNLGGDIARVSNARHAPVAGRLEAQRVQLLLQAGGVQVLRDHVGAGRQRRLHVRLHHQALLDGLLRHKAGGNEHARVRRVRARRDGGNDNAAVLDGRLLPVDGERHRLAVLLSGHAEALEARLRAHAGVEVGLHRLQRHVVVRALRAADAGLHGCKVQLEVLRVLDLLAARAEHARGLGVVHDAVDVRLAAARRLQVLDRLAVDREVADRRSVLGRHVGDRCAVRQREVAHAVAVELDELADNAELAQVLRDRQHQIRRRAAVAQLPRQLVPNDLRQHHRQRLAQHGRLSLDATNTPSSNTDAVDHRGVRVGANNRVGVQQALAVEDNAGKVLQVHLVHNSGARRHDQQVVEGGRAPLQELEALAVAIHLEVLVHLQGASGARGVHLHGVVDHKVHRDLRVDLRRIAAKALRRVAHGGEVDDARHAGEVLQHDAGRLERDLDRLRAVLLPVENILNGLGGDIELVTVAHRRLEQHTNAERKLGVLRADLIDLVVRSRRAVRLHRGEEARVERIRLGTSLAEPSQGAEHGDSGFQ
mmetsp:Transcript_6420/g.7198  ORF Transcript_6420/g.7198 Transcript_6420/m.7198 type:complete len:932 (-) Transcript_6420:12-2807(-)